MLTTPLNTKDKVFREYKGLSILRLLRAHLRTRSERRTAAGTETYCDGRTTSGRARDVSEECGRVVSGTKASQRKPLSAKFALVRLTVVCVSHESRRSGKISPNSVKNYYFFKLSNVFYLSNRI